MWPFTRKTETRSATSYTSAVMEARAAHIRGATGTAELTATAQSCISMWENGLALAEVKGTNALPARLRALVGRALALRGECVLYITPEGLTPAHEWDLSTRNAIPRAYRLNLPDTGGGRSVTALAREVLHFKIGCTVESPYTGTAPLKRSNLTSGLLHTIESALADVFANAPIGTSVLPMPDGNSDEIDDVRSSFQGRRGGTLIVEGVAASTAAGMHPQVNKTHDDLTPHLDRVEFGTHLEAARAGIEMAFGVLPGMTNKAATGPLVRESQRHIAQWTLQPMAVQMAEEMTEKLGADVTIDTLQPLQAYDAGGRSRAVAGLIQALAQAKEAGIDPGPALATVNWKE